MLRLKEVELLGFKSFADRTRLVCDGTTAAVVGPNGCGKSNLSDAVSWVLGAQSARMLRGERMSDVIFNGTGTRPPTGLAEVSIVLVENSEDEIPADDLEKVMGVGLETEKAEGGEANAVGEELGGDGPALAETHPPRRRPGDEIKVTRRLFRSGESEYLLNGETCRLRDIQDIFRGTGLGPESYAIIEQGRIGQILSSKPSDRRLIIEEAAGISKFKSRKRLAEAKLESSRQNLSRINDILEEVSKQVNSLKRQSSKAARYKELHEMLRGRQRLAFASRLEALEKECNRWQSDLKESQAECAAASEALAEIESARSVAASDYERLEEDLKSLRDGLAANELESERTGRRIDQLRQQAAALEARAVDAASERVGLSKQLQALEADAFTRAGHAEEVRGAWKEARAAAAELAARQSELAQTLTSREAAAEERRQAVLAAVSRASEIRNELIKSQEMNLSAARALARVESDCAAAEAERERFQGELEVMRAERRESDSELARLEGDSAIAKAALDRDREEDARARAETERLGVEFSQASARKQALEESLARHAYSTDSVRSLLSASSTNANGFSALGVLADFVEVSSGFEGAVGELLKAELECVVVNTYGDAHAGVALLEREGSGRCAFFVTDAPGAETSGFERPEVRERDGVLAAVADVVRVDARLGADGAHVFPSLSRSFVAESAEAAERLVQEFPDCQFVTREGEHYRGRCVSGGRRSNSGPLALRRDFRALERRTSELESQLNAARQTAAEIQIRLKAHDEELRELASQRQNFEKQSVLAGEKLRQAEDSAGRCEARIRTHRLEASQLNGERARFEALLVDLEKQAAVAQQQREELSRGAAEAADAARRLRLDLDDATNKLSAAQVQAGTLEERCKAADAERQRILTEVSSARERLANLAADSNVWREECARLEADAVAAEAALKRGGANRELMVERLARAEEESRLVRGRRDDLAPKVGAGRLHLETLRERRASIEVAHARAEAGFEHHAEQCRQELATTAEALRAEFAASDLLEGEALRIAEEEVRELKEKIERLGPVNMMALEELQEASERLSFLDSQRQDLLASIEDTNQTIREIDAVSRKRFLEAFTAINSFFSESFRALFGGGAGEMRFSDAADPESGIDLVVQPPGKRLQNVLLLSGGEKALTALALLIAVFRHSPSPFCILDEVDAPLDEANVLRFARMIRNLSERTQFIIITHNKRTMEACRIMYGVTMEEPGVSRLVSVRFEERAAEPVALGA